MKPLIDLLKSLLTGHNFPRPIRHIYQLTVISLLGLVVLVKPDLPLQQWYQSAYSYAYLLEPYLPELVAALPDPTPEKPASNQGFATDQAPHQLTSFTQAKRFAWDIYLKGPYPAKDFYCGCNMLGNRLDLKSCGYVPRKNKQRAERVEWEHIVPAWTIGHQRQCWQEGGRKNCAANDQVFKTAEADLHNLVPVVGEVNGDRSNFALTMLSAPATQYGKCEFVVDFKQSKAMPPKATRGVIARTYLYMADTYQLRLSKADRNIYNAWSKSYPVTAWEKWRNQQNACVQKNSNPYVGQVDLSRCGS